MAQNEKLYSLRGKVKKVYDPREVRKTYGGREVVKHVSDMYLILETGSEVKVSFWDMDIADYEGQKVAISALSFKGKYKEMPQWSSTKTTKIQVEGREPGEDDVAEEAPEFDASGAPVEQVPEGAIAEGEEPITPAKAGAILRGEVPAVAPKVSVPYAVHPKALEQTIVLAKEAMDIAQTIALPIVAADPQAFQALFATLFIQLGLADWKARQK